MSKQDERKHTFRLRILDLIGSMWSHLIPWAAIVLIFWATRDIIVSLAGKSTLADIGVKFLANVKISDGVIYLFGLGGVGYGLAERQLRRRSVGTMSERTKQLEQQLDPKRSSSKLTKRGTTRPEDRG